MMGQNKVNTPEYSIVILCYRVGRYCTTFVNEVIENVDKLNVDYELILVANYWEGSNDETTRIAEELSRANARIKVVALPKEGMMGWDMISGLKATSGRIIAVIDGDGQMPPYDLVRVYKKLKEDNLDFAMTYRVKREDKLLRSIMSLVYNFLFRLLFPHFPLRDINSKPKIFTREVCDNLNLTSFDWFLDTEIVIQVRRMHLKIAEIPTIFKKIYSRPSYVKIEAVWEFIRNIIKSRISEFKVKKTA